VLGALDYPKALEWLQKGEADIVLFGLAHHGSLDLLSGILQASKKAAVIALADAYDANAASACLRCGAQDYLSLEGLSPKVLSHAMVHAWERHTLWRKMHVGDNELADKLMESVLEANHLSARMKEEASERIRAEKALVETVAHYRFMLDSLPQIVWTTDPNGSLAFLNDYWVQYSGRSIDATLKAGWRESIHPEDYPPSKERWLHSLKTGEPFELERRMRAADGSFRWHQSRAVPRRNPAGQILEWIGTEAYIDDQKRVEERLKEAHDELGIRILERTSELAHANESLQAEVAERRRAEIEAKKAREVAEAANRSKTEFLANISHEIRTPMNGIIGMTELTLETELDAQQRENLQLVSQSAESLLTLINDMLDFAKIEAGKIELDSDLFVLREVVEDAIKVLTVRASQKGLSVFLDIRPGVPRTVIGDPLRLRQVMINLISNAIKFTEQGKIVARVSAVSSHGDYVNLLFEVADTGIGIPEDKQQLIFEAFAQVDGSMTRRFGGTGLGLAIVSNLVKQMGGDIRVRSKLGEGSTFSFNLPTKVESSHKIEIEEQGVEHVFERYRGMRVMVVAEGRLATGFALCEMLKSLRMEPSLVRFGEEALYEVENAQSQGQPYRLILVDASLGDMSGAEFIQTLGDQNKRKVPVILLLSGAASPDEIKQANNVGPDRILFKPIVQPDLADSIVRCLQMLEPVRIDPAKNEPPARNQDGKPPLRVLVAEDNPVNQAVAERMLMSFGCVVVKAPNGRVALEAVEREPFDLILMDIQMPEMDGMEATRMIRSLPDERANLPIVAMTAHAMKGDRERFLAAGLDHYISKPFHKDELLLLVKSIVSRVRKGDSVLRQVAAVEKTSVRERFLKTLGGDKALFLSACDLFAELMPKLMEELGVAIQEKRAQDAERLARNLKSSLDSVGARETSEKVTVLEANLRSLDYPRTLGIFARIQAEISQILEDISGIRTST